MLDRCSGATRIVASHALRVLALLATSSLTGCSCGGDGEISHGQPLLCVQAEGGLECEPDGSDLDWGSPPAGQIATRTYTLTNLALGGGPLVIEDVLVTDEQGGARLFDAKLCQPTCDVQQLGIPAALEPGARATLVLTFDATDVDGAVPAESLHIISNTVGDTTAPLGTYIRPFTGVTDGCLEGRVDANQDKTDGCECSPSIDGVEYCDALDNDCDGTIDEDAAGTGIPCDTGLSGHCQDGTIGCVAGELTCVPNQSSTETCDGLDNDCDGATDEENTWFPFNEGLSGGNMATVEFDPRFPGVVYAATGTKVYRSTDDGVSFQLAGHAPGAINAFGFPADDPATIFAASTGGVLRTQDNGATWTTTALSNLGLVSILVHPADPGRIFVGSIGGGIYRSTNGGASFGPINEGVPYAHISSLVGHPTDPDRVVAGVQTLNAQGAFSNGAILTTTNGGANWTTRMSDLGRVPRLVGCPTNGNALYAAVIGGGLAESQDGGASWDIIALHGQLVTSVAIAPDDCGTIYAGTQHDGILRSPDAGQSFAGPYATGLDIQFPGNSYLSVASDDPTRLLASNHSGLFLSTDGGQSWERTPGIEAAIVLALGVSPAAPELVWLSSWGQGLWSRNGLATVWERAAATALPRDYSITNGPDPANPDRVVAGMFPELFATVDGGDSFSVSPGPANVHDVAFHPVDPQTIYVGTQLGGVWKSSDGGINYAPINNGLPSPWPTGPCVCQDVRALVIDRNDNDIVYLGTNLQGIYRSFDGGDTWQPTAPSLAGETISCLVQDGDGDLFACVMGQGIWHSHDRAETFTKVTQSMPELNNTGGIYIDAATGEMYAASDRGVRRSTDQGATWQDMDSLCLPSPGSTPILMHDNGQRILLIGTSGDGVMALPL